MTRMAQKALSPAGGTSAKIGVRWAGEDRQELADLAAEEDLTLSEVIRRLVREGLRTRQLSADPPGNSEAAMTRT